MTHLINEKYMLLALKEAEVAKSAGDLPFGAVIVSSNDTVPGKGRAENSSGGDVTCHAELQALREASTFLKSNNLNDCVIYCTNEPCVMCAAGIFQAKIKTVIIGASRKDLPNILRPRSIGIEDLAKDSGYEIVIQRGMLKEKVLMLFSDLTRK